MCIDSHEFSFEKISTQRNNLKPSLDSLKLFLLIQTEITLLTSEIKEVKLTHIIIM